MSSRSSPAEQLARLFDEHLSQFPPEEQERLVAAALALRLKRAPLQPPSAEAAGELRETLARCRTPPWKRTPLTPAETDALLAAAREPAWTARMFSSAQAALSHQTHRTHRHSPASCDACSDAEEFVVSSLQHWSGRAALEPERGE